MGPKLEILFKLQEIDSELAEKQRVIDALEQGIAARGKAMQECRARIDALVTQRKQLVTERALAERRVSESGAQVKERRQRLSRVRNEKELHALEGEITTLREEIAEQEEQLLAVMQKVEDIEKQIGSHEKEHASLAEADQRQTEAEQARATQLKSELASARADRDSVAGDVDAGLRSKYENVFHRRKGLAVVTVVDGACSGCHMYVPPQTINEIRKSGIIHVCPSCQRILFVPEVT